MDYLNWVAEHWLLTVVLTSIVFNAIGLGIAGRRR